MTGMIETPVGTVANVAAPKTESAPEQGRVQRDRAAKPCDPTSRAGARQAYQVYSSRQLFGATREIVVARELTKRFESIARLPLGDAIAWLQADPDRRRGEFVLVVAGAGPGRAGDDEARRTLEVLLQELPLTRAARVAARLTGVPRQELYRLGLQLGAPGEAD